MSTTGQFTTKNPTLKRILKEAAELASQPSPDYTASPLDTDLFEWHFTLRGPPSPSPFETGIYHGRIILPPAYPLKPPSFRFLTPTGRFEVNREICLSISGHHEETWQPAWGIRTALVAIRSFMDTDAKGQLGGMDASEEVRRRLAGQSRGWKCGGCGKTNEMLMREQEEVVRVKGGEGRKEEVVPEQLRLAYREDLAKEEGKVVVEEKLGGGTNGMPPEPVVSPPVVAGAGEETAAGTRSSTTQSPVAQEAAQLAQGQRQHGAHRAEIPAWIDKAIYGIVAALIFLVWRKLGS